ncbi:MAG TPA: hypothetical protein VHE30_03090 [Polyangiaceae bacterium]|nr:hypothetical protein [Polyangiaceae bacterium]
MSHRHSCPRCSGKDVHRSRTRSVIERLVQWFEVYPFRCVGCHHRFFALGR